jgi:lipid II isoglutaminyl synthase (glutamine-hydrolysing)
MKNNHKSVTIGWLYPELMNIYGDIGNIICLTKRCEWRGIKVELKKLNPGFADGDLKTCDLILMGGAQDKQQEIVNKDLKKHTNSLKEMADKGIPGLFVCGGYQFLGNYYKDADGNEIAGLSIFDLHTISPGTKEPRLIGNIVIKPEITGLKNTIIGFENHGGRTYLGKNLKALGSVLKGFGNSEDGTEGAVFNNFIGTYLHGPILPKNPELADYLIKIALSVDELSVIDDSLENQAHSSIAKRLGIAI